MIIRNVISEARDVAIRENKYVFSKGYQSTERAEVYRIFSSA